MPYFQHRASLRRPIGSDGARAATRILTMLEPTAGDVAQLDRILAAAHDGEPAPPGAFVEPVAEHGGRPVLMALDYSYFLSGRGPRDIPEAVEDSGACEGTGRLGPPIPVDDPAATVTEPGATVTDREPGGQDEDATVTPRPDDGEPSPVEEGDGAPAGEEAALAARERIAAERAEYGRLKGCRHEAALRMRRLTRDVLAAEQGSRHGNEVFSRLQLAQAEHETASDAAAAYLRAHPDAVPVYAAARRFHDLGIATVPPKDDGSKSPIGEWKTYMECLPRDEELLTWHQAGTSGLGIVCGRTDRADACGLEMFEPEGRAVREGIWDEFLGRIAETASPSAGSALPPDTTRKRPAAATTTTGCARTTRATSSWRSG
jgi:hypothetical protein